MTTGPLHYRTFEDPAQSIGVDVTECRCRIGADHFADGTVPGNFEDDDDNGDGGLSIWDAADIWASKGKDEDYTFGYSESELQTALNED